MPNRISIEPKIIGANLTPGASTNVERAPAASTTYAIWGLLPPWACRRCVAVALRLHDDAELMRQLLLDGGYDERDVILANCAQVAAGARELLQSASVIAKIFGAEIDAMQKHIEVADAG
jgi:hypothetical protein